MSAFMIVTAIWLILVAIIFVISGLNSDEPVWGIIACIISLIFAVILFVNASTVGYIMSQYKLDINIVPIEEPR